MTPFTIIKWSHTREFLDHINSIDEHIQLTCEDSREDGSMPFLDILIRPNEDGSLSTTIYRKPTHTDLCLQWDSHHTIRSKYSVIGTLHHRAQTICSNAQLLQQEEDHLYRAITKCKYPAWALNRINIKTRNPGHNKNRSNKTKLWQKQQPECIHNSSILQRAEWESDKGLQQTWRAGLL